ncbi:MAG: hypothetical protein ACOY3L_01270 [Pseudomonadota bacterium]
MANRIEPQERREDGRLYRPVRGSGKAVRPAVERRIFPADRAGPHR